MVSPTCLGCGWSNTTGHISCSARRWWCKTLHLSCVSTVLVAKTAPFFAARRYDDADDFCNKISAALAAFFVTCLGARQLTSDDTVRAWCVDLTAPSPLGPWKYRGLFCHFVALARCHGRSHYLQTPSENSEHNHAAELQWRSSRKRRDEA